jgi:hypothetical protein
MNTYIENPTALDANEWQMFDQAHDTSFEFNVKSGRMNLKALMTEKRAKHCLCMLPDPQNTYNKIILAIGGITVSYWRDPYQKQTK